MVCSQPFYLLHFLEEEIIMEKYANAYPSGSAGHSTSPPPPTRATIINGAIAEIESLSGRITRLTQQVSLVVDNISGTRPSDNSLTATPSSTLQDHLANLSRVLSELEGQVERFF